MSNAESRPADAFGLWLLLAGLSSAGVTVFASSRTKPPVIFALGLGIVLGLLWRIIAQMLQVQRTRRVVGAAILLMLIAFAVCFGLGYRRAAMEWKQLHSAGVNDPLAQMLLEKFPKSDPSAILTAQERFTFADYLSRRLPNWSSPWPEVLFGAEWLGCVVVAGMCVGLQTRQGTTNV